MGFKLRALGTSRVNSLRNSEVNSEVLLLDDIYMLSGMGLNFPESSVRAAGLPFKGNVGKTEILVNVPTISCVMPRTVDLKIAKVQEL